MDELERWAAQVVEGDPLAAGAFVRATQRDVWRLCAHLTDPQIAEDLTQETYLRAFPALRRFQGRSSVRTWLLSIARRVCADHLRRKSRNPQIAVPERAEWPEWFRADDEVGDGVAAQDAVDRLAPERREAFVLTQLLGLSYAEAAAVTGCPVGTIRSRVARARDDLVSALGPDGEGRGSGGSDSGGRRVQRLPDTPGMREIAAPSQARAHGTTAGDK